MYKWISSVENEDGTSNITLQHRETGEVVVCEKCILESMDTTPPSYHTLDENGKFNVSFSYSFTKDSEKPVAVMKRNGEGKWVLRTSDGKTLGTHKYRNDLYAMFDKEYAIREE